MFLVKKHILLCEEVVSCQEVLRGSYDEDTMPGGHQAGGDLYEGVEEMEG